MSTQKLPEAELAAMDVAALEAAVRHHNRLYWDEAAPEIADPDYDRLVRRLKALAPSSAVLDEMGPAPSTRLGAAVTHRTPMLSLDKCYDDAELNNWASKFEGDVLVTPKLDGIAASLRYDAQGRLAVAATRGSGTQGDDITVNAIAIESIPAQLSGGGASLEVRGEIFMRLSVFARFGEQFANPRNLTAGAVKHKDPERCRAYDLSFAPYDLLGPELADETTKIARLAEIGFAALDHEVVDKEGMRAAFDRIATARPNLDFEIDGVVFKANRVDEQVRLGATGHHPRHSIAYKFQGDSGTTTLDAVGWSVARTGAITPVAQVAPVTLSGVTVSRASLHNAGYIDKLGLTLGAEVVVTRRGGVIPNVEHVTTPGTAPVELPETCPSCERPVVVDGDFIYCSAPAECRDAIIGSIAHYAAIVDIQGFGDKLLAAAYDAELLRSPADLYELTAPQLLELDRVGQKLADKLIGRVDAHRTVELATFLRALGVDELGRHVSTILRDRYRTIAAVRAVAAEELAAIHTIGDVIAEKVVRGIREAAPLIDRLLAHVTLVAADPADERVDGPLRGMSFVFTGKLVSLDRKTAQQRVRELGGDAPSGVTKQLTHLVIGEGKGKKSSKQVKVEKYNEAGAEIAIITESEFVQLAEGDAAPEEPLPIE